MKDEMSESEFAGLKDYKKNVAGARYQNACTNALSTTTHPFIPFNIFKIKIASYKNWLSLNLFLYLSHY